MIDFDAPLVLMAAPVVAVIVTMLAWWGRHARVLRAGRWSEDLRRVAERTGRAGGLLLGLTGFLILVALAGPRFGRRVVTTESKALDLVIAIDVSRSMLAEDVAPSRLERVQVEAQRLIQDLRGDRIGLLVFAGHSFILSPLTIDAGALRLLVDGADPDMSSAGGTELGSAIQQGHQLLVAGEGVADRVLVVFTDGEAHDSLGPTLDAVAGLVRDGIHLVLVAVGGTEPTRIPVRDPDGVLLGFQRDADNNVVGTVRRDDILAAVADAGRAAVVSGELRDQAGAVRELINGFKRTPQATSTAPQDVARAWIPTLAAIVLLMAHTLSRRTAALVGVALLLAMPATGYGQQLPNPADEAWQSGDLEQAARLYAEQVRAGEGADTAFLNLGTAALAVGDSATARQALGRVIQSVEPELRFRALYNLGLLNLRQAAGDSVHRREYLAQARHLYREALLLRPGHEDAKWNYELAILQTPPPPSGGQQPPPPPPSGSDQNPQREQLGGLTREQAEQILNSMLEEERDTQQALNRRRSRARSDRGKKDW